MKVLAIDASANVVSVALTDNDKLIGEYTINHKKTHSQTLMPMIENLLSACEIEGKNIDLIATTTGPGSFTGLRIGVETAKALAHGWQKPIAGVDTTFAMACNIEFCGKDTYIVPIMDAKRNQVYTGIYMSDGENITTVKGTCAISISELLDIVFSSGKDAVFLGDGVQVYKDIIKEKLKEKALFAKVSNNMQRAASVAVAANMVYKNKPYDTYLSLIPQYFRKSQAEREYEEKQILNNEGELK